MVIFAAASVLIPLVINTTHKALELKVAENYREELKAAGVGAREVILAFTPEELQWLDHHGILNLIKHAAARGEPLKPLMRHGYGKSE